MQPSAAQGKATQACNFQDGRETISFRGMSKARHIGPTFATPSKDALSYFELCDMIDPVGSFSRIRCFLCLICC